MRQLSREWAIRFVAVLLCGVVVGCGGPDLWSGPAIVDEDGNHLDPDRMAMLLAEGGWVAESETDDAGDVTRILVRRDDSAKESLPPGFVPPPGAIMVDESTPIRDEDGNELTLEEFGDRMMTGGWMPEPEMDEDGNVRAMVMRRVEEGSVVPMGAGGMVDPDAERFVSQPFPGFEYTTLDGRRVTRDGLQGKITVVNFWFRTCKPCMMEVPELNRLVSEFADDGVVFLAFTWDKEADAREAVSLSSFAYEVIADATPLIEEMEVRSYPTHLILDRDGVCVAAFQGYTTGMGEALAAEIEKLID